MSKVVVPLMARLTLLTGAEGGDETRRRLALVRVNLLNPEERR